jgi:hypothetical protein
MTAAQRTIHASLETKSSYSQAAREGAALAGELGVTAQLIAMSAQYAELKAAGKLVEAAAVKAEAIKIYEGTK